MVKKTPRVTLSEFTSADAAFILELLNSPGWLEFIGDRGIKTEEDAANYIEHVLRAGYARLGFGFWKVSLNDSGKPAGMCGLIKRDTLDDVDIGFAFLPEYAGQGLGYESASACMQYAREKLNLKRLVAITVPSNRLSIRLLEKLGLRFEKQIEEKGEDLLLYSVLL